MGIFILLLIGVNLHLIFDFLLDNYYFNGTIKGDFLILNSHFMKSFNTILKQFNA